MSCLYLDKRGLTLKSEGNVLVILGESGRLSTVPLNLIERICIRGGTQLSATLLAKLGEKDIAVLVLQGLAKKPTLMLPSLRKDAKRRQVQYQLSQQKSFTLLFAREVIYNKIVAQCEQLITLAREAQQFSLIEELQMKQAESLCRINKSKEIESILGIEGAMANYYFRILATFIPASLNFSGRNKRPPKDPYNVVLSFGYTLLHAEWVRQIYMMGLDPYIGFLHQPSIGRESLACDLMEPLRPYYDIFALKLFKEQILRADHFTDQANGCFFGKAGRLRFYEAFEQFLEEQQPLIQMQKKELFSFISQQDSWKDQMPLEEIETLFSSTGIEEMRI